MLLEDLEDKGFEQERVVDGDHLHVGFAKPARTSTPCDRVVHDIISYQEERLKLHRIESHTSVTQISLPGNHLVHQHNDTTYPFNTPAEYAGLLLQLWRQDFACSHCLRATPKQSINRTHVSANGQ